MTTTPKKLAQVNIPLGKNLLTPAYTTYSAIVPLSSTTALAVWNTNGINASCRVMTSNADGSIVYGPVYAFNNTDAQYISACKLGANSVFISFRDTGNSNYGTAIIANISGTAVTFGSKYVFYSSAFSHSAVTRISDTSVFIGYAGATSYLTGIVATITGSAIAYGTAVVGNSSGAATYISCATLDSTHIFIAASIGGSVGSGVVAVVSGNTITSYGTPVSYIPATTIAYSSCATLSSTSVFIAFNATYGKGIIATISGTDISYGTTFAFTSTATTYVGANLSSANSVFITFYDTTNYVQCITASIDGTNITYGDNSLSVFRATASSICMGVLAGTLAIINYQSGSYLISYSAAITITGSVLTSSGVATTVLTGATDHTEISSIYLVNTGALSAVVTLLAGGIGGSNNNVIRKITLAAGADLFINLANCPIILEAGETLRAYQDSAGQIPITCYGLEIAA